MFAGHVCGTCLRDMFAGHVCGTCLRDMFAGHVFCGILKHPDLFFRYMQSIKMYHFKRKANKHFL